LSLEPSSRIVKISVSFSPLIDETKAMCSPSAAHDMPVTSSRQRPRTTLRRRPVSTEIT
jgi:hypothetical protein